MAVYVGYTTIDTSSYANWYNATIGNFYDADGLYGCQCWDYASEFWWNVGFPQYYPQTGANQYASECWTNPTSRANNAGDKFDLIYNKEDIKQGDWMVFAGAPGHISMAAENYDPSHPTYIASLGQNQGGSGYIPYSGGGTNVYVTNFYLTNFLGAFRYKPWEQPTPPTPTTKKHKFPWFIYVNKWRDRNNYGII